jgi:hypothetical protein
MLTPSNIGALKNRVERPPAQFMRREGPASRQKRLAGRFLEGWDCVPKRSMWNGLGFITVANSGGAGARVAMR